MSKILLAVSERWVPDNRIDAIAELARRLGGSVLVTHVVYGTETGGTEVSPGERVLKQVASMIEAKQIKTETLLLFSDDVANATVKTAQEHQVSIILLGLSSKGMLARLIEGNVAQEVIRGAKMPVLLLPPDWMSPI